MINDVGIPVPTPAGTSATPLTYAYSDDRLKELLLSSAQLMQGEITFSQVYTINILGGVLSPDPTLGIRDDAFINLVMLKAACIIDNCEARYASKRAVYMRDGSNYVDMRGQSQSALALWKKGWCQNYSDARFEFMAGNTASAGMGIIGPFRIAANADVYGAQGWTPDGYGVPGAGGSYPGYASRQSDALGNDGRFR